MHRRILNAVTRPLRQTDANSTVHFHAGPQGQPAVCHDERCDSPRLDPAAS